MKGELALTFNDTNGAALVDEFAHNFAAWLTHRDYDGDGDGERAITATDFAHRAINRQRCGPRVSAQAAHIIHKGTYHV